MEPFLALAKNPIGDLAYILLALSIGSLWVYRKIWIWGPIFLASLVIAFYGQIITYLALFPIALLFFCHLAIRQNLSGFLRMFASLIAVLISIGLKMHLFKGFNNILLIPGWQLAKDSVPINWYMNFDFPIAALFPLALYIPLVSSKEKFKKVLMFTIPWTVATVIILLGFSLYMGQAKVDLKLPAPSFIWLVINLLFTVIPEEAFYRGFLQSEIVKTLPNRAAPILAILIVSLLFGFMHLLFVHSFGFVLAATLTGLLYGGIFQLTGSIEASIITHYLVNVVHFFFFSYPMLTAAT